MKSSLSAIQERRIKICSIIQEQGSASVEYLAKALQVTTVTIRRDLDALVEDRQLARTYGGAKRLSEEEESANDVYVPQSTNPVATVQTQRALAKAAADLIGEDMVLVNSSSTASYVVEYLGNKPVTVISNNIRMLSRRISPNTILLMTGGQVIPGRNSLGGLYAMDILRKNYATKCIIGVCGISIKGGLTSPVLEESIINELMISQTTGTVIIIASSDKIGCDDHFRICDLSRVNVLVTDSGITEKDRKSFEALGIRVVIAE